MPNQNTASAHRYHLLTADRPLSKEKILPRAHVLAAIAEGFRAHRFVLLHGKSGIGKTKIAELVFRNGQSNNAFAAWYRFTGDFQKDFYLQISDHALLEQLETQIAFGKENGLGSDLIDQRCALVCRRYWEESCPGSKLIIVDGVQDFHALAVHLHLLDIPDVRVLITTQSLPESDDFRLRDMFSFAVVEAPPLDTSELETMLGFFGQTIEDAQLAEYLGQSPLLLRLFLKNNTPEQPEKSRALVARLLREGPGDDLDGRLIYALLDFVDLPPAILWTLMQLAAMPDKFHDPDFIAAILGLSGVEKPVYTQGYNIFKGKGRNRHSTDEVVRLDDVLGWLVSHGWLDVNVHDEVHSHSSLIQPIRKFTQPRYDYFLEQGQQLDLTFFLNENGYDEDRLDPADLRLHQVSDTDLGLHLQAFIAFVDDENSEEFRGLLVRYADLLQGLVRWQEELEVHLRIVSIWEHAADEENKGRLSALSHLAHCLSRNGLYKESLERELVLVKIIERIAGPLDRDLAMCYNNIGGLFARLGNLSAALEYHLKGLEIQRTILPPDDSDLAISYNNLGSLFLNLGDFMQSVDYHLKALAIQQETLPSQHPHLAISYNNIGSVFGVMGDAKKSMEFLLMALSIEADILPPNHPDLARTYNNLGMALEKLGNHDKALEFKHAALEIRKLVLEKNHPDLGMSFNSMGVTLRALGNLSMAMEYQMKALEIFESAFSSPNQQTAVGHLNIGRIFMELGDPAKALEHNKRALEILNQAGLTHVHPYLTDIYGSLALNYEALNDPLNAEKYRRLANPEA